MATPRSKRIASNIASRCVLWIKYINLLIIRILLSGHAIWACFICFGCVDAISLGGTSRPAFDVRSIGNTDSEFLIMNQAVQALSCSD
jgi:hypothetical protein